MPCHGAEPCKTRARVHAALMLVPIIARPAGSAPPSPAAIPLRETCDMQHGNQQRRKTCGGGKGAQMLEHRSTYEAADGPCALFYAWRVYTGPKGKWVNYTSEKKKKE